MSEAAVARPAHPFVSVVVPARDEERTLGACLASIRAQAPVRGGFEVVVVENGSRDRTRAVAEAYLQFLYSDAGQDLIGKHHYRPIGEKAAAKYATKFPKLQLVTIADFGGWRAANAKHFEDGGIFDQIFQAR